MNTKKAIVSFLAIATLLFLVATVSATEITDDVLVQVNGIDVAEYDGALTTALNSVAVEAGDIITVKVYFTADLGMTSASDVRIKATLEADKESVDAVTTSFDVEDGKRYSRTLTLTVPFELDDEVSDDLKLEVEILNGDEFESELDDIVLRVQRPSYNADVVSVIVSNSINAGQIVPVDVVLKNTGYNDLDDVYVTVRISELGISKPAYFGDLVAIEDDDNEDTVSGRIYLEVPYDVAAGIYTLEVEVVGNDGLNEIVQREVAVQNGFPEIAMRSGDNLLLLNPSNQLKVYTLVYPAEEVIVVVQAGSSKVVPIKTEVSGEYDFDVFVFSGDELVGTVNFAGVEDEELASPIVLLTVVLGIIFLVLLVVLIVLITKKPQKSEEFGESYY
jgi:hypothetical protein